MHMDKLTETLGYSPKKIAVFRAIKVGDLLCAVPAFRALRQAFPNAHIALISLAWAEEFVRCYPHYFDEFVSFPGWPGLPEQPLRPDRTVAFLQQMQSRQWDVVLQLQGDGTLVNAMCSLFNARVMAGYYPPEQRAERWVANTGLFQPYPIDTHEVFRHVRLMAFLGIAPQGYELDFRLTEADRQEARTLLHRVGAEPNHFICLHVGGISGRRWPEHQFAAVADVLAAQGYTVVLTGTAGEQPIVGAVQAAMTHPSVSIAGKTSLRQLAAVLSETTLLISNDTGVAHLAVACETPSVVVFTSADPAEWGPLNRSRHRVVLEQASDCYQQVVAEATDLLTPKLADIA
ncbi:glycosyltransferase family 9 protein [Spirosoma jeollabukense]